MKQRIWIYVFHKLSKTHFVRICFALVAIKNIFLWCTLVLKLKFTLFLFPMVT